MTDVHTGGVFIGAGMSDDMIIGGGVRVTARPTCGCAVSSGWRRSSGARTRTGRWWSCTALRSSASTPRGCMWRERRVLGHRARHDGDRLSPALQGVDGGARPHPGGQRGGGAAPVPPAAPPPPGAPPPVEEAGASGALLGPSAVSMDEMDELAALEDIRYLFGDLDLPVDSGRPGNRAAVLEDLEASPSSARPERTWAIPGL